MTVAFIRVKSSLSKILSLEGVGVTLTTGTPNLGCSEEGNFIQCKLLIVIEQGCESSTAMEQLPSVTAQL